MRNLLDRNLTEDRLSVGAVPDMQLTNFWELLRDLIVRKQASTSIHQLSLDPGNLPDLVSCDPVLMEVLISNLLDNAIKYSPDGGAITLHSWSGANGSLLFEVKDQGIGISVEDINRIFDRFYRSGELPEVAGAGLGLYLVQQIASLHNGEVTCSSTQGHGSVFTVRLKITAQASSKNDYQE